MPDDGVRRSGRDGAEGPIALRKALAVIPVRFGSTRFPGKPLALIAGRPMIRWVVEGVRACRALDRVIAHEHYLIPAWTTTGRRIAYSASKLVRPDVVPPYPPEGVPYMDWFMTVWSARMPPRTTP